MDVVIGNCQVGPGRRTVRYLPLSFFSDFEGYFVCPVGVSRLWLPLEGQVRYFYKDGSLKYLHKEQIVGTFSVD